MVLQTHLVQRNCLYLADIQNDNEAIGLLFMVGPNKEEIDFSIKDKII